MSAVFARWGGSILDARRDRLRVRAGRDRCPTAAIIDSQTVPAADTVPRSSRGGDGGKKTNGVKRHLAGEVNGLLLAVVVTAASIQDRDAAHRLLAALRGSFSTIRLVWADRGYPGRLLIWAKDVLPLTMCTTSLRSNTPSCCRVQMACSMASSTIEVAIVDATRQPRIRLRRRR